MDTVATVREENVSDHKWKFNASPAGGKPVTPTFGTYEKCFALVKLLKHNLNKNRTLKRLEEQYLRDAILSIVENSQSIGSNKCRLAKLCSVDSPAIKLEKYTAVMESRENPSLAVKAVRNVEKTTDNPSDLETLGCARTFENVPLFANSSRIEEKTNSQESNRLNSSLVEQYGCKEQYVKETAWNSTCVRKSSPGRRSEKKKVLLCMFLLMLCFATIQPVDSAPAGKQNDQILVNTYPMLTTPQCENIEMMQMSFCPSDAYNTDMYIQFCGFNRLCSSGTKPVCVDTTEGMRYICSEENLSCSAGYWMHTWVEEKNPLHVKMKEEKCPLGRYQPTKSSCFDACRFVHQELASIGEHSEVYLEGDHQRPTLVYCNYKLGFFNQHGRFLMDFDDKGLHSFVCSNVKDFNPCEKQQAPLPNGTCVGPCEEGYVRDDHDNFHCKEMQGLKLWQTDRKSGNVFTVNTGEDKNTADHDEEWHS